MYFKLNRNEILIISVISFLPILIQLPFMLHFNVNPLLTLTNLSNNIVIPNVESNVGYVSQALGRAAAKMWMQGIIPWWNPYEGIGVPLAGEMQSAAFFPLVLLQYFPNGFVYFYISLQIITGLATYFFLKEFGLAASNAFIGALLFELNGTFAIWFGTAINPIPFLPLLLFAVERLIKLITHERSGGWKLLAIVFALAIYAGFPETALICMLFVFFYTLVRMSSLTTKARIELIKKCFISIVLGLMLASPLIVAFFDYLPLSMAAGHVDGFYAHSYIIWQHLPVLFMPHILGFMFKDMHYIMVWGKVGGFFTLLTVFVGLSGLAFKSYRAVKLLLVIWIMVCLGKAYGFLQLNFLFDYVPFKYILFFRYYNVTAEFALSFLVALSLHDFSKKSVNRYLVVFLILTLLLLLSLGVIAYNMMSSPNKATTYFIISISFTLLSILLAFVLIKKNQLQLVKLLLVTETLIYFIAPLVYISHDVKHQHLALGGIRYLEKNLGLQRFYAINRIGPNYGSYFALSQINYVDVPISKNWVSYVRHSLDPYLDPLDSGLSGGHYDLTKPDALSIFMKNMTNFEEMGVKYLVIDNDQKVSLPLVYQDKRLSIYALPNPKPYFEIIKGNCKINSSSKTELTVDCLQPSTLLRRELYMPGWRSTVNSQSKIVHGYQGLLQIVHLPTGKSHIIFSFLPPYEEYVLIIFLLAMIILCWPSYSKRKQNQNLAFLRNQDG